MLFSVALSDRAVADNQPTTPRWNLCRPGGGVCTLSHRASAASCKIREARRGCAICWYAFYRTELVFGSWV